MQGFDKWKRNVANTHQARSCSGKRRFDSIADGEKQVASDRARYGARHHVYWCGICVYYHVGTPKE